MIEYGKHGEPITDYEAPKSVRYTVNLKDSSGNIINGIGSDELIEKVDNNWYIIKSDNSKITLHKDTQDQLNSISIYKGISNIFLEDENNIVPTNMEVEYIPN